MIQYPVHNLKGEKIKEVKLSDAIFNVKRNDALIHQIYVSQYANQRQVIAHTKDRAERAGSGRKPWKQKGTGRARVGSVRTPIWRKGGVVFGPSKDRNFKKDIPKKMNRAALLVGLSGKARDLELIVVESLKLSEIRTKAMSHALLALKLRGKILIGFSEGERNFKRATRNLETVKNVNAEELNVLDILNHKYLLLSEEGLKVIERKYNKDANKDQRTKDKK